MSEHDNDENADSRWTGEHGHLYDDFVKCSRCRFYAKDPAIVAEHEKICSGKVVMVSGFCGYFCGSCRFDGQTAAEVHEHYERGECVDEISAIMEPIYTMNYDVLERRIEEQSPKDET